MPHVELDSAGNIIASFSAPTATSVWREDNDPAVVSFLDRVAGRHLLALRELQQRMETEGVWDTWVTYMFAVAARRNALMKRLMRAEPVEKTEAALRNTMTGAGITAAQIARILA